MGIQAVNAVLEIDEKFGIDIETPCNDFGDLVLAVLFQIHQRNPESGALSEADFQSLNSADFSDPIIQAVAQASRREAGAIQPETPLAKLFPRPGRTFAWNRLRKILEERKWKLPALKQNPLFDKLTWLGFYPFYYSCITLFIACLFIILGLSQPFGPISTYVYYLCMGIILLYVIFLIFLCGLEIFLGLFVFPDKMETVAQLKRRLTNDNFLLWSAEFDIKSRLKENLSPEQIAITEQLKEIIARNLEMDSEEIQFDTFLH